VQRLGNRRRYDVGVSLAADEAGPHEVPDEDFAAGAPPFPVLPLPHFFPHLAVAERGAP